jgi:transcription antitermination factor NusG
MFGRYLFVRAPIPWLHLMAQRHVSGVVGIDGVPSPIANAEIEKLRQMDGSAIPHRTSVNPHRALRTGDLAEIQAGPFSGQVVKVAGLYGAKAKIFVNLFGTVKEAEISVEDLEAA